MFRVFLDRKWDLWIKIYPKPYSICLRRTISVFPASGLGNHLKNQSVMKGYVDQVRDEFLGGLCFWAFGFMQLRCPGLGISGFRGAGVGFPKEFRGG